MQREEGFERHLLAEKVRFYKERKVLNGICWQKR
jgi:hypothetical protein